MSEQGDGALADFPADGILPKHDTQAADFVASNPQLDGRGVVVAVLDTGVDPGAEGLQETPDGRPKVIDLVDATGDGDVDMSLVRDVNIDEATGKCTVQAVNGRELCLARDLVESLAQPPKVRVGTKLAFSLFPTGLVARMKGERSKEFDEEHRLLIAQLHAQIAKHKDTPSQVVEVRVFGAEGKPQHWEVPSSSAQSRVGFQLVASFPAFSSKQDNTRRFDIVQLPGSDGCVVRLGDEEGKEEGKGEGEGKAEGAGEGEGEVVIGSFWARVIQEGEADEHSVFVGTVGGGSRVSVGKAGGDGDLAFVLAPPTAAPPSQPSKEELEQRLKQLHELHKARQDPGPSLDCVVFQDSKGTWRALVDTNMSGDLTTQPALADFALERQFHTFGEREQLNFGVNILDEGRLLSLVCDCGPHGTHVAGIVAAYFPERSECNGVAPGAQIVSVKVGDRRLDSMETGTALARAMIRVVKAGCHVINLSFGEDSQVCNAGRFMALADEVVNKHGIVFLSSAGNNGPALSTGGAPGACMSAVIGVGAMVSAPIMRAAYSMPSTVPSTMFTWSSRGPAPDGHAAVSISAPGGAIAPVPNWTLRGNQLMNGTSMSSPHAAGCVALVLSACKAHHVAFNPHAVRAAVENTAQGVEGACPFALGCGVVQVARAVDWMKAYGKWYGDMRFVVGVGSGRGVYLREPHETQAKSTHKVTVTPTFHDDAEQASKLGFEVRLCLVSNASWVTAPDHLLVMHAPRTFSVHIDPTGLCEGVHTAEIVAIDLARSNAGPVFRVPITVVVPRRCGAEVVVESFPTFPGCTRREFIAVPAGATWAEVTLFAPQLTDEITCCLHTVQLVPHRSFRHWETHGFLRLVAGGEYTTAFACEEGTVEVCVAQWWASVATGVLRAHVTFHGIRPSDASVAIQPTAGFARVTIRTALREEYIAPVAKLTHYTHSLRPRAGASPRPLYNARDMLWEGRVEHEIILEYSLKQAEESKIRFLSPLLNGLLYENEVECQLWFVCDEESKQEVAVGGDHRPAFFSLRAGDYLLRLQIRHENPDLLSRFKDMVLGVERPLKAELKLSVYATHQAMVQGAKALSPDAVPMPKGASAELFVAAPAGLPKEAVAGDVLSGVVTYGMSPKRRSLREGAQDRPKGYPLSYVVPVAPEAEAPKPKPKPSAPAPVPSLQSNLRDAKIAWLAKLTDKPEEYNALFEELVAEHPTHLALLTAHLKHVDAVPDTAWWGVTHEGRRSADTLEKVLGAAGRVLGVLDCNSIAAHFGLRHESPDSEMQSKRDALVEALYRQARALAELEHNEFAFATAYKQLDRWVEVAKADVKYLPLLVKYLCYEGKHASALEAVCGAIGKQQGGKAWGKALKALRNRLVTDLGWELWSRHLAFCDNVAAASAFPPF